MLPQKIGPRPGTCEYNLICKGVFSDVIMLRILIWDHSGLAGWALNPMTTVLMIEEKT